ncbi:hypothetical protein JCM11641_007615 [Rhodosporidiobolus odoratus]
MSVDARVYAWDTVVKPQLTHFKRKESCLAPEQIAADVDKIRMASLEESAHEQYSDHGDVDSDMEDAAGNPDDSIPSPLSLRPHAPHADVAARDSPASARSSPHVQPDVIPLNYPHVPDWKNVPFPSYYAQSVPTIAQNEASAFYPNYPPQHFAPSYISDLPAYPVPHTATTPSNTLFMVNPGRPPHLANPYAPNLPGQQFLPTPIVPSNAPSVFVPHHPSPSMPRKPAEQPAWLRPNPPAQQPYDSDSCPYPPEQSLAKPHGEISERAARRYGTTRERWMAGRGW